MQGSIAVGLVAPLMEGEQSPHTAYPAHVCTFLLNPFTNRALNLRLNYKPYEGKFHSLRFFYIAQCFSQCSPYHRCTINNHYPNKKEMHSCVLGTQVNLENSTSRSRTSKTWGSVQ